MARSILILVLSFSFTAHADLFDFGGDKERESRIPTLIEKLKALEMKADPSYDDAFNQHVKAIENAVEEEKLYCSGEAPDSQGKTLPAAQKQLCMRELKKNYVEATDTIFDLKKKYLGIIHKKQIDKLSEIQSKLKSDIEKNF
ncbi:hypothetical protein ACJVC5_18665 [Peredibacter sp. HCB2-198]|uniref:hypothetical protein n=1 Tax=Peredibacter sp. HCB2-198 TaxID=3383025 RepID=UPI0038B5AABC